MRLFFASVAACLGLMLLLSGGLMSWARRMPPEQNAWLVMARSSTAVNNVVRDVEIVRLVVGSQTTETLVRGLGMVYRITFSPDGRYMAYDTANLNPTFLPNPSGNPPRQVYYHQIYVQPVGKGEPRLLVDSIPNTYAPAWSPDGEWIAFIGGETRVLIGADGLPYYDERYFLYKVRPDGSELTRMAQSIANGRVQWSPDGQRLVFPAAQNGPVGAENNDIYIINADGSGLKRLTFDPANDLSPFFSPDGEYIVFLSDRGKPIFDFDVWIMRADGTLPDRLYETVGSSGAVAWSPDGRVVASVLDHIALETQFLPLYNIQLTDLESGTSQRVSPMDAHYWAPAWSPPANAAWQGWPVLALGVGALLLGALRMRWRTYTLTPTSSAHFKTPPSSETV